MLRSSHLEKGLNCKGHGAEYGHYPATYKVSTVTLR